MHFKTLPALALTLSVTSCASEPPLSEELAGKSKPEQHAILKSECLREARWHHHNVRIAEICEKMAAEMK